MKPRTDRWPLFAGIGLFGLLLVLAWTYYLERTAIADSSFMSFIMLDERRPEAFLGRYGAWLPQILPLALIQMDASLEMILRSYSIAFVLVHVGVFCLLLFALKDRVAAWVQLISLCAGYHYMFYYGISELNQGLSFAVLAWALVRRWQQSGSRGARLRSGLLAGIALAWSAVHHQVLLFPALLLVGSEVIEQRQWRVPKRYLPALLVVVIFLLRITLLSSSKYEQDRMPSLADIGTYLGRLGELGSTKYLLAHWTLFKGLVVLLLSVVVIGVVRRQWLSLVWTFGISGALLFLVLITDRDQGSPRMFENYYTIFGVLWAVPLARMLAADGTSPRALRLGQVTACAVLLLGCIQIQRGHHMPTAHVRWAQRITTQLNREGVQKAVIHPVNFPWAYAWGTWPSAFETALISAVNGPRSTSSIFVTRDQELPQRKDNARYLFLGPEWSPIWFTTNHFNRWHFKFAPGSYTRVTTMARDETALQAILDQASMAPLTSDVDMVPDRFTVVELEVHNNTADTLHAIRPNGEPVRLAYRILRPDGAPYAITEERTSLEMDIAPHDRLITGLAVERPLDNGDYVVETGLTLGVDWKPLARFHVHVHRF